MFVFSLHWKCGRRRGERGLFFFWKCFFHCGEAREGKGVRGVEVNVFFSPSLEMWKEGGKGLIFFLEIFFSLWKG